MSYDHIEYSINGKQILSPLYPDELKNILKKWANEKSYDNDCYAGSKLGNDLNPYADHPANAKLHFIRDEKIINIIVPALKRSYPNLNFKVTGHFIYGPGDFMDEHTNISNPSNVMYLTYATGKSKFSYRFSQDDDLIETYDNIDGLTVRTFTLTSSPPYTFHKVDCESGYRVSVGLRYVEL